MLLWCNHPTHHRITSAKGLRNSSPLITIFPEFLEAQIPEEQCAPFNFLYVEKSFFNIPIPDCIP